MLLALGQPARISRERRLKLEPKVMLRTPDVVEASRPPWLQRVRTPDVLAVWSPRLKAWQPLLGSDNDVRDAPPFGDYLTLWRCDRVSGPQPSTLHPDRSR